MNPAPKRHAEDATARGERTAHVDDTSTWALTVRIRRGDERAFATFYDAWFDRTFAMARSITRRDESFCLDLVQDCMMRVVKSIPSLGDERAVTAWMGRTIFTTAIDAIRRDERRTRRERAAMDRAPLVPGTNEPEKATHEDDRFEWIRRRLAELPEADRQLVLARFEGGNTLKAIGATHGISGDAAHGRIYRVMNRLRQAAKEFFGD